MSAQQTWTKADKCSQPTRDASLFADSVNVDKYAAAVIIHATGSARRAAHARRTKTQRLMMPKRLGCRQEGRDLEKDKNLDAMKCERFVLAHHLPG